MKASFPCFHAFVVLTVDAVDQGFARAFACWSPSRVCLVLVAVLGADVFDGS